MLDAPNSETWVIGVDVGEILAHARRMSQACGASVADADNPGLILGAALTEALGILAFVLGLLILFS